MAVHERFPGRLVSGYLVERVRHFPGDRIQYIFTAEGDSTYRGPLNYVIDVIRSKRARQMARAYAGATDDQA